MHKQDVCYFVIFYSFLNAFLILLTLVKKYLVRKKTSNGTNLYYYNNNIISLKVISFLAC